MPENLVMPKVGGYDIENVVLMRWLKHEGDLIQAGEPVAEVESDKANIELPSPHTGRLVRLLVVEGTEVRVGTVLAVVALIGEEADAGAASATKSQELPTQETGVRLKVSPIARKLADEWHLDLASVQGTGLEGRITREDVERAHAQLANVPPVTPSPEPTTTADPAGPSQAAATSAQPLNKMRRAIAARMTQSATTVPHFTVVNEVDMGAALDLRSQLNTKPGATKLSITDLLVRAVALALRDFPILNSSFVEDHLVRYGNINIGVAVMLEDGLVTPVVHQADQKSLFDLASLSSRLIERARSGHLQVEDLRDGTFTISNLGMFDVEHFIPIINPPEAAILAVGSVHDSAAVIEGVIQVRKRMNAALAVDHRVTDGATAAQFLQEIKGYLQSPIRLLI